MGLVLSSLMGTVQHKRDRSKRDREEPVARLEDGEKGHKPREAVRSGFSPDDSTGNSSL